MKILYLDGWCGGALSVESISDPVPYKFGKLLLLVKLWPNYCAMERAPFLPGRYGRSRISSPSPSVTDRFSLSLRHQAHVKRVAGRPYPWGILYFQPDTPNRRAVRLVDRSPLLRMQTSDRSRPSPTKSRPDRLFHPTRKSSLQLFTGRARVARKGNVSLQAPAGFRHTSTSDHAWGPAFRAPERAERSRRSS